MGDLDRDTAVVGDGGRYTATLSDDWEIWGSERRLHRRHPAPGGRGIDRPAGPGLARRPLPRPRRLRRGAARGAHPAPHPSGRGRRGEHDPGRPGHRRGPGLVHRERPAGPRARRDRHARGRRSGGAADDGRAPAGGRHREPVPLLGQHGEPAAALAGRLAAARPHAAGVRGVVPVPAHRHLRRPAGRRGPARRRPRHAWAGRRPRTSHAWQWPPEGPPSWVAPSLDLYVRFHQAVPDSEHLFVRVEAPLAAGALITTEGRAWSQDGRLLASGSSQLLSTPVPPA